nr:MAG: ORF1 [TTV-like mini virus]
MPYYRNSRYRRRFRKYWRRRPRGIFRRRLWRRRRRYPVRKRKLKKIIVRQWQPSTIRKLKIRGMYPLFEGTRERISNNFNQWSASIAPQGFPGGGLWSIIRFSLYSLYELHLKGRNWWTMSNCSLPLIKYHGCKLKFYKSTNTDYITVYTTCGDMTATLETYHSSQPSILNLNKHKIMLQCKQDNHSKKPYKTKFIKPPPLFENKWYFQRDIAKLPLLMLITSSASFDRWYINSKAESNTMGFISLNTDFFVYHNFKKPPLTTGYTPNATFSLYTSGTNVKLTELKWENLIYLGNTKDCQPGKTIGSITGSTNEEKLNKYFSDIKNWGNPFFPSYFHPEYPNYYVTMNKFERIKQLAKTDLKAVVTEFTNLTQDLFWECRYNPENDSSRNAYFITDIETLRPWENPSKDNLTEQGLPLWLLLHGTIDYHQKLGDIQHLMTDHILCITSDYISPTKNYYVPIDEFFLKGNSPYTDHMRPNDELNWFPKLNFQQKTINDIVSVGPGTPKLPPDISSEAHIQYEFRFKLGGCPPQMDDVCDPNSRSKWPTPSNLLSSTLLQSPETPIEYYLSTFDQRRGMLTTKAAKRIKKDIGFKETMLDFTGQTTTEVPIKSPETSSEDETSTEEKEKETYQLQFRHHRRKQRKLQQRILQLLEMLQE